MSKLLYSVGRPFAWFAIGLIRFYRFALSPLKYVFFGANAGCRFTPTCSQYALECFRSLPLMRATYLSIYRILRCNPWGGQGEDPVPKVDKSASVEHSKDKG
ncbi:membrane protein insertion efficiency factor YidD [Puniceicoccaceae bacterium K14]|nr:membrane protein insertion efficiency factor YidD [Puniceicoccaceae bacterium K14]